MASDALQRHRLRTNLPPHHGVCVCVCVCLCVRVHVLYPPAEARAGPALHPPAPPRVHVRAHAPRDRPPARLPRRRVPTLPLPGGDPLPLRRLLHAGYRVRNLLTAMQEPGALGQGTPPSCVVVVVVAVDTEIVFVFCVLILGSFHH